MALNVGSRLGHYDVTALIGEGGMGQVYQATDTKLKRQVALKILPEAFSADPERLARFQREAEVLASLNHPNIAAIYGLEEAEGIRALVLELVEGPTLADRIKRGPIPLDEALPIAKQIAEALEAAHEAGVIHRDLKPANIKVRDDGTVKVLDFGLAKALDPSPEGDPSQSPTLTAAATQMGVIMGTAAYMSPEQAAGKVMDKRGDIWSFGVVLFEMLSGKRLFTGETVSHVLGAVLQVEPEWDALPAGTPQSLRNLLRRCLQKDRKRRLRDVGDAWVELEDQGASPSERPETVIVSQPQVWQRPIPAVLVALALAALGGFAAWAVTRSTPATPRPPTHFVVPVDGGHEMHDAECPNLAVSPDGRTLAYVTEDQLHVRPLDRPTSVALEGTDGAIGPFFSPDGQSVGFAQDSILKRTAVNGGPVVEIAGSALGYNCANASWGEDGAIVYRNNGAQSLSRIRAAGGVPEQLTMVRDRATEFYHMWPQSLDGGTHVLYTIMGPSVMWEDSRVVVENVETGKRTTVVENATYGRYVSSGHVVYATSSGVILALPFDLSRLEPTGDPFPVESGVRVATWGGAASFAVSDGGTAAFVHASNEARQLLWWVDRTGRRIRQVGTPVTGGMFLSLSPDGRRLSTDIQQSSNGSIWIIDTASGARDRVTFNQGYDGPSVWSPDGLQLAYASNGVTPGHVGLSIYLQEIETGGGQAAPLYTAEADTDLWVSSWSPDGDWLAFVEGPAGQTDIYAIRVDDIEERIAVAKTTGNERFPQFSPDGRWVAFSSDEAGRNEVHVVSFPDVGRPIQVSTDGGEGPRWSASSDELFFWMDTTLMVSKVSSGDSFSRQPPTPLFEAPDFDNKGSYVVSPDGSQILLSVKNPEAPGKQIHVVENWFSELTKRVPVN